MIKGLLCIKVFIFYMLRGVNYFCLYSFLGAILVPSSNIYFSLLINIYIYIYNLSCLWTNFILFLYLDCTLLLRRDFRSVWMSFRENALVLPRYVCFP